MQRSHGRLLVAAACCAMSAVGAQSALAADAPDARLGAAHARLVDDLKALPDGAGDVLREAADAPLERVAAGEACGAVELTRALRIRARRALADWSTEARATIEADVLGLEAALLVRPDTKGCGGGATPGTGTGPRVQVVGMSRRGLRVRVALPDANLVGIDGAGQTYVRIAMEGMGERGAVGAPALPALTRQLALPQRGGARAEVVSADGYDLEDVLLAPRQDEAADGARFDPFGDPPFAFDEQAYAQEGLAPAAPAAAKALGRMRDIAVGGLELDGGQYDAKARRLHVVTALDVVVRFDAAASFGRRDAISPWNRSFVPQYRELLNWRAAERYLTPIRFRLCGEELLVVTSSALRPAADALATARRSAGFITRVVEVGGGAGQIGTTAADVQRYIRGQLNSRCLWRPSYVAIVGDVDQVPTSLVATPWAPTAFDGMIATDNPYGLADDADLIPDLAVGRIPARSLAEAQAVVRKITGYERLGPRSAAFYRSATITSFFQADDGTVAAPQTRDSRGFTKASETVAQALEGVGKSVSRVYVADTAIAHPTRYYDNTSMPAAIRWPTLAWNGTGADVISQWNAGRFLIMHRDHGAPNAWGSPDVTTADVPSLTNGALLPVVLSINCASGFFDGTSQSLVEQMVLKASGGAVGAIGDSRNSPTWTNNHMALGLVDAMFPSTLPAAGSATAIRRMGDVLVAGKRYMDTQNGLDGQDAATTAAEHSLYHWFGDPTMEIRTVRPRIWDILDSVVLRRERFIVFKRPARLPAGAWVTVFKGTRALGRAQLVGSSVKVPTGGARGALRIAVEAPGGTSRSLVVR